MAPEPKKPRVDNNEDDSPQEDLDSTDDFVQKQNKLRRDYKNIKTVPTDVTFIIEGKKVYAGSDFLSIHSPFFKALLKGNFAERNKEEIELKDISYEHFVRMLYRLSTPSDEDFEHDEVEYLLALADRFDIKYLTDQIELFLEDTSVLSISSKFLLADRYRLVILQAQCLDSIGLHDKQTKEDVENSEEFKELSESAKSTFYAVADITTYPFNECSVRPDVKYETLREVNCPQEPSEGFIAKGVLGGRSGRETRSRSFSIPLAGLLWSVEMGGKHRSDKSPFLIVNRDRLTTVDWSVEGFVKMETLLYSDEGEVPKEKGRKVQKFVFSLNNSNRVGKLTQNNFAWHSTYCTYVTIYITKISGVRVDPKFDFNNSSEFSDTVVKVQNKKFHVNKQYLSTVSSYFSNLFYANSEETKKQFADLKNANYKYFAALLNWMYPSSWRNVTASSAFSTLMAAETLDVDINQSFISDFIFHLDDAAFYPERLIFLFQFYYGDEDYEEYNYWNDIDDGKRMRPAYNLLKNCRLFKKMHPVTKNELLEWLIVEEYKEIEDYSDDSDDE